MSADRPWVTLLADLVDEANAAGAVAEDGVERPRSVQRAIQNLADEIERAVAKAKAAATSAERARCLGCVDYQAASPPSDEAKASAYSLACDGIRGRITSGGQW